MPVDIGDEWKECRSTIGRFDGILVDLRKTGFGFVTLIASGATFFFANDAAKPPVSESAKFAVFTIIMVLTLTLYFMDRVHQILLQEAVELAVALEKRLGFSISDVLGSKYKKSYAIGLGVIIYLALLVSVFLASVFSSDDFKAGAFHWLHSPYQVAMLVELLVGVALIEFVVAKTRFW